MGNLHVQALETEKNYYNRRRVDAMAAEAKYQREFDSLKEFKKTVTSSQDEFMSIVNSKKSALTSVSFLTFHCITAERYEDGMSKLINGIGANAVGAVYSSLVSSVNSKLNEYANKINRCESEISSYENQMAEIDKKIKEDEENTDITDIFY